MCFNGSIIESSNPYVPHISEVQSSNNRITEGVYVSYNDADLRHTERVLIDEFANLVHWYANLGRAVQTVFLYTYLIPCDRDGDHGHCAQTLSDFILYGPGRYYRWVIGWGNRNIRNAAESQRVRQILSQLVNLSGGRVILYDENDLQITAYVGSKAPFAKGNR